MGVHGVRGKIVISLGLSCVEVTLPPAAACDFCPNASDLAVVYGLPASTLFFMWSAPAGTVCFIASA